MPASFLADRCVLRQSDTLRPYRPPANCPKKEDVTRKRLIYRKDDRAMRPVCGCPEKFGESLNTPTATFAEIFNGLLF